MRKKLLSYILCAVCCVSLLAGGVSAFAGVHAENGSAGGEKTKSPVDLFTAASGITLEGNVDLPEYFYTGKSLSSKDEVHDKNSDYWQPWQINGVKVTATTTVRSLQFNNVIDVASSTKDDCLLAFSPITASRHVSEDFSTLYVTLQDYDDPDNWLKIEFYAGGTQFMVKSYARVHTSTGYSGGYRWGQVGSSAGVAGLETSIAGFYNTVAVASPMNWEEYCAMLFTLRYDASDNAIYLGSAYLKSSPQCVLKLDDIGSMGADKVWGGFKNGRVKLSITVDDMQADAATYFITQVAGVDLSGDSLTDTVAPALRVFEPEGNVSVTAKGYAYPLFNAEFNDVIDGVIPAEVYIKAPSATDFSSEPISGSFIPDEIGEYVIRYSATDGAGNVTNKDYNLTVVEKSALVQPYIRTDDFADVNVGEVVTVSEPVCGGGVGKPSLETYILRLSDSKRFELDENDEFLPYVAGEYVAVFATTDYIGLTKTVKKLFTVKDSGLPVYGAELKFYGALVSGVAVDLPVPVVYDYTTNPGQRITPEVKVKAVGSGEKADYSEVIEGYTFTPTTEKFGSEVTVYYEAYCKNTPEKSVVKSFTVPIISGTYMKDYLIEGADVSKSHNAASDDEGFVSLSVAADAQNTVTEFLYPLYAGNVSVQLAVPSGADNCGGLSVTLTDFANTNNKITFIVKQYSAGLLEVSCNGKAAFAEGQLGDSHSIAGLSLNAGKLYDGSNGNYLFDVTFDCEKAWLSVDFVDIKGDCTLWLKKINNHLFKASYADGNIRKFSDGIAPKVVLNELLVWDASFGADVALPLAKAYDEFSSHMNVFVCVEASDGAVIYDYEPLTEGLSFKASSYGEYYVTYYAKDASGNWGKNANTVYVRDVTAPELNCSAPATTSCKVGATLSFAKATATDNLDGTVKTYVFILDTRAKLNDITESGKYTFNRAGKYVLRYCAIDDYGNVAFKDYEITVAKGE